MLTPYWTRDGLTIFHGDAGAVLAELGPIDVDVCVFDPPWDRVPRGAGTGRRALPGCYLPGWRSLLAFTDGRRAGETFRRFGEPWWVFTWDTLSSWNTGKTNPLQRSKFCFVYTETYTRDSTTWGEAPETKSHPSTRSTSVLAGRRLTDVWRESLRWLHNPEAGSGSAAVERFRERQAPAPARHMKPEGWVRCLLGNVSRGGLVLDPFLGSGTTLVAARALGLPAVGIDVDLECCEFAVERLKQQPLALGGRAI